MDEVDFEISFLESVVSKAWVEEKVIMRALLGREIDKTSSICQGITDNLERRLIGAYDCRKFRFDFKGKAHIALYVVGRAGNYIIDGTISQFLPEEGRRVFRVEDYPLKEESGYPNLQTW